MNTTLEFPCVIYGVEPENKIHVTTQLANIAKCNNIAFSEIVAYSDLLAHGYGLWDKTGITENELEEYYQKRHRKNYCSIMYKECESLRSCTELFTDKMHHAYCLICDFGNKGNSSRLEKELIVLRGLLSRCINISDIKDFGGAEKIFTSWSNICGHAVVGSCPIVRFTFHMYSVLEYYLLINTDSFDVNQLAMDFNSCFADSYIHMAEVLKYEVDDIAELFFNYIATHFSNHKALPRNQVLSILEELRSTPTTRKTRKKRTDKDGSQNTELPNNAYQSTEIPAEILASIRSELNLEPDSAIGDVPSSPEDIPAKNTKNTEPVQEFSSSSEAQPTDELPVNDISDAEHCEELPAEPVQNPAMEGDIADTDCAIIEDIESDILQQDAETYAETDTEINKTEQTSESDTAELFEESPVTLCNEGENMYEFLQEPTDDAPPEHAENLDSPDSFNEIKDTVSVENEGDSDAAALDSCQKEDDSDKQSSYLSEKKFRTITDKTNITMLNEFNCQRLTLHNLMEFVCAEVATMNGICGILLYIPGTKNYYFAIQTSIITGVIQHLFHSNTTILTTNTSLLLNYLERYNVKITCKTAALDLHLSLYLSSKNNKKYLVNCRNIIPISHENGMLSCKKPQNNLVDSMTFYTEIHYLTQSYMTKKLQKNAYVWYQLEEFLAHSYSNNSINYPYALFEKSDNTTYQFRDLVNENDMENRIQIKNITSAEPLYEFFCHCCSQIRVTRLDALYSLRICNITDQHFTLSFCTGRKDDLVDSLWQLVSALYEKTYRKNCESLTIVLP